MDVFLKEFKIHETWMYFRKNSKSMKLGVVTFFSGVHFSHAEWDELVGVHGGPDTFCDLGRDRERPHPTLQG